MFAAALTSPRALFSVFFSCLTCDFIVAGLVELPHVEIQSNDGEHEDGHEQQQADLQKGNHGLHNGLEHHLQAWGTIAHTATTIQRLKECVWIVK